MVLSYWLLAIIRNPFNPLAHRERPILVVLLPFPCLGGHALMVGVVRHGVGLRNVNFLLHKSRTGFLPLDQKTG